MIDIINKSWSWKGFEAKEILLINEFGNIIFRTDSEEYWRICPEELHCEIIANNKDDFESLISDPEYKVDWEVSELVKLAQNTLGELEKGQKYCLKMPAAIGGLYEKKNLGKISFSELISFSGDMAFQIKDLKDGDKLKLTIKD